VIDKQVRSAAEAVAGIKDGSTVLCGGFGTAGVPDALFAALIEQGARDLVMVSNNAGTGRTGLAGLIANGQVRKVICSYPRSGGSVVFEEWFKAGKLELELLPQGTLSERMRCAGAGLGGFYSPVSVGTRLADGKEVREINGKQYVLEMPLKGDVALIRAERADRWGNLIYRRSSRNFNPVMAMAAELTVAEAREMAPLGALDPDQVMTPGIFVDRVVVTGGQTR
jgi:3-oxoadipate CoA-transferase alpha subunit